MQVKCFLIEMNILKVTQATHSLCLLDVRPTNETLARHRGSALLLHGHVVFRV